MAGRCRAVGGGLTANIGGVLVAVTGTYLYAVLAHFLKPVQIFQQIAVTFLLHYWKLCNINIR